MSQQYNRQKMAHQRCEQEQGFVDLNTPQYTYYTYTPLIHYKQHYQKLYNNPLKIKPKPIDQEEYINKQLQKYLTSTFASRHKEGVIQPSGNLQTNGNFSFDSGFQSGNLQYVIHQSNQYELYIKPDTNTMTHFQWFYFKVRNKNPGHIYIVIKNFLKAKMLYREGLRPFHRATSKNNKHFEQISSNVYFKEAEEKTEPQYYQLSFDYHFQQSNDEVEFSSQPPYTHNRYCRVYKPLSYFKVDISRTVLGNKIEAFIVNQNTGSNVVVVAMARQHPGESVGSWMMEGFVQKLVENPNPYCWILLPMINIDGVVLGNNRTGVQGYDFNRHWYIQEDANRYHLFPELKGIISYFKRKKKQHSKKIKIFIDFHGHSSEQNVFSYGPPHHKSSQYYDLSKLYPYLISKRNPDFNLQQCSYRIQQQKRNCSRYIFFNKFGFSYSYTIESSFGLYRGRRITEKDVLKIGEDIFFSTVDFIELLLEQKEKHTQLKEVLVKMKEEVIEIEDRQGRYDSDSDNEDQNTTIRAQFQKKLVELLSNRQTEQQEESIFDNLIKKRNNSYVEDEKRSGRQLRQKVAPANDRDVQRERQKTEQSKEQPSKPVYREKSIMLPKIKWEERKSYSSKKSDGTTCDLDRLTLQEMKERLMKMKHSELGRRILIINRYQNS